jgi:hypothetical protein
MNSNSVKKYKVVFEIDINGNDSVHKVRNDILDSLCKGLSNVMPMESYELKSIDYVGEGVASERDE